MGRDGGTARISAGSPYGQVGHAVEIDVIVDCVVPWTDAAEAKSTLAARLGSDRSGDAVVAAGLDGIAVVSLKGKPFNIVIMTRGIDQIDIVISGRPAQVARRGCPGLRPPRHRQ